ncbi:MAG: glutathione S-transferase [Pseudomonadota bacterium]|nr:glutathione S-transferase [Pseudomonadota bacterium]
MSERKLHRHPLSGHSHRAELFLSLLGLEAELIDVDLLKGEHKKSAFLAKNSAGQIPVLEDSDITLADSNAILVYLAGRYDAEREWLPQDAREAAEVQRFLSIAAGPVYTGPASARLVTVFGSGLDHDKAIQIAHTILSFINRHLADRNWLASDRATIADIANYTYIAHAPEGNVSLEDYANIRAWLKRIEALPGFVPMQATAVGLAA